MSCYVRTEPVGSAPGHALLPVHTQLCFVQRRVEIAWFPDYIDGRHQNLLQPVWLDLL